MLVANDLAIVMRDAVSGLHNRSTAFSNLGKEVSKYITDNLEILFSWIAISPPPQNQPDPKVSPSGRIIKLEIKFDNFLSTTSNFFNAFSKDFIIGLAGATAEITGFSVSPVSLGSAPAIASLQLTQSGKDNLLDAFKHTANQIIVWIKGLIPAQPAAGSNGQFIGSGNIVSMR